MLNTNNLEKKCKECGNTFIAKRVSQDYCTKDCGATYRKNNADVDQKRKEKNHRERMRVSKSKYGSFKEESDLFWSQPSIITGVRGVADYLNIGVEEIRRKWTTIPFIVKQKITLNNNKYHSKQVTCITKESLDKWIEETQYWKFKEKVIKNYKEPLKPIQETEGFGYYGALTATRDGDGIQCHMCGKFFAHLSGHIYQVHKINVQEYKEKFEIAYSTPLTSDNYREVLKIKELERIKSMTPEQKEAFKQSKRDLLTANRPRMTHGHKIRLETKNRRGTCPDQLIDQIKQCAEALSKTPSKKDFVAWCGNQRFIHKIYDTFGSYTKAVEIAGLNPAKNYIPTEYDKQHYDDEELLEYLKIFYEQTKKSPTATDWYSNDLPGYKIYIRRFGSIKNARYLAEVPEPIVDRKKKKITIVQPGIMGESL